MNPTYEKPITEMTVVQIFRQFRAEIKHDFAQKKARRNANS